MRKMNMVLTGALVFAGAHCFAGDLAIEGNVNVTSNLTSWSLSTAGAAVGILTVEGDTIMNGKMTVLGPRVQLSTNATAAHANTFVWSDGTVLSSTTTNQFSAYALNGFRLLGGPIYGNGAGLTNINPSVAFPSNSITSDKLASGAVTASKLATGSVGSSALAAGAVTAASLGSGSVGTAALTNNSVTSAILQDGSVGTNKAFIAEWNTWGNARFMSVTGTPDLVINPGRIVAGYGMSVTNISSTAYGASQNGYNLGKQSIGPSAYGASQQGYLASNSFATNNGIGSIQLFNLSNAQVARITGHASIGLGACTVTNDQAIVAGDGLASRGKGTVTALGFYGNGAGLTNLNFVGTLPTNSITADKLASGAVTAAALATGSVTATSIAAGSIGTNKAFIAEWNNWVDARIGRANPADISDWSYTSDGTSVTITGYNGAATDIVIPDWIDGLPVTAIGYSALAYSDITRISGGRKILNVGIQAFMLSTNLTSVTLPAATSISGFAFGACSNLLSVTLPAVTLIDQEAFAECTRLTSVVFSGNAPSSGENIYNLSPNVVNYVTNPNATGWVATFGDRPVVWGIAPVAPLADGDAATKAYLRSVLSALPPQGDLSMGSFTNGAPTSFPLTF